MNLYTITHVIKYINFQFKKTSIMNINTLCTIVKDFIKYALNQICNLLLPTSWNETLLIYQKLIIILLVAYILVFLIVYATKFFMLCIHTRMMRKANILVLKKNISTIEVENINGKDFSFVTDNLEKSLIEERDTFNITNSTEFKNRMERLKKHYENIKNEIVDNKIPDEVLSIKDINYILNHVITEKNITFAIDNLNKKRENKDAELAFIGNKIGLYEYSYHEKNKMTWKCYRSDHFTWKVFKELYLMQQVPEGEKISPRLFFDNLLVRLAKFQDKEPYRQILMHTLCYLFSSLGIDLLIVGKNCKNRQVCLASVRSARIDRSHLSRIHISVDESFSDTDQLTDGVYSIDAWARRGIEEEIGLFEEEQKKEVNEEIRSKITYTDFSIIMGYGEIGLSGIVEDKKIDTLMSYPGQDKALESDGMFFIPMPNIFNCFKIFFRPKTGVQRYVSHLNDNPITKLPWVEFAPPIYIRTMLRKLPFPIKLKDMLLLISIMSFIVQYLFEGKFPGSRSFLEIGYFILWIIDHFSSEYSHFSLWVPLWNGNVKILQSTGREVINSEERNINNGLYMMTEKEQSVTIPIKDIQIKGTPLCAVRKSSGNGEVPISFYHVKKRTNKREKNGNLRLFSTYFHEQEIYYYIVRTKTQQQKSPSVLAFSFNFGLGSDKNIQLKFDTKIDKLNINRNSLLCYFGLHDIDIDSKIYCNKLPDEFNMKYQLYDLFEYKGDYYWSACHKEQLSKDRILSMLSELYLLHIKDEENTQSLSGMNWTINKDDNKSYIGEKIASYKCETVNKIIYIDIMKISDKNTRKFEKQINKLIGHSLERLGGKLNELEVIALQYIMARKGIFIADIQYGILFKLLPKWWKKKADSLLDIDGLLTK